MSIDSTRRFTDREVAVVLRKASELEEHEGATTARGLSLEELKEIAREVGISARAIERAAAELEGRERVVIRWAGAPLVRKAMRAVPAELDRDAIARLVRVIDEEADRAGSISEALGSVRWTASDRFRSHLVSITPGDGETSIHVVEKAVPRMRRLVQLLPAAWGVMLAMPFIGAAGLGLAAGLGGAALGAALGAGSGRLVWNALSAQSARRVERLAAALTAEARAPGTGGDAKRRAPGA